MELKASGQGILSRLFAFFPLHQEWASAMMASVVFLGVDIWSYFCWVDVWFFGCSCPNLTGLDQNDIWFGVILDFRLQTVTNPRSEVLVGFLGSCLSSPRLV